MSDHFTDKNEGAMRAVAIAFSCIGVAGYVVYKLVWG